ncbi:MAG TPA: triose-phosphate isomerase, partial [Phycisphaerales bacterium]|nr:triose-phosphate isomerase [Phycisphaerales bacterium]
MHGPRTPVIGGNWKMNTNAESSRALAEAVGEGCRSIDGVEVFVCPPFPYLRRVGGALTDAGGGVSLAAQDVWHEPDGAFTGEVSAAMLLDCGVSVVLTGHSERRHVIGENDGLVNKKTITALNAGLSVVLCIGETLDQREKGETDAVNEGQLRAGLDGVAPEQMASVIVAYEPVWAIGTGKTATPGDAQDAHAKIRGVLGDLY